MIGSHNCAVSFHTKLLLASVQAVHLQLRWPIMFWLCLWLVLIPSNPKQPPAAPVVKAEKDVTKVYPEDLTKREAKAAFNWKDAEARGLYLSISPWAVKLPLLWWCTQEVPGTLQHPQLSAHRCPHTPPRWHRGHDGTQLHGSSWYKGLLAAGVGFSAFRSLLQSCSCQCCL